MSKTNTKEIDTAKNAAEEIAQEQTETTVKAAVSSENKLLGSIKYFLTIGVVLGIFMGIIWQPTSNEIGTKVLVGMLIFGGTGAVIGLIAGFLGGKNKDKKTQ